MEDHYFQEKLEQNENLFPVNQINKMYTVTFTFMPTDKDWIYDPSRNPYHNCPAYYHFDVEAEVSEKVIIIDGHNLPC